jgi:transcriptional regulator with XRE-family HTH domain
MNGRSRGSVLLARTCKTQDEIAERIGVSRVAVSNWLHGKAKPGMKRRGDLCAEFEIPEDAWDEAAKATGMSRSRSSEAPPPSVPPPPIPADVQSMTAALEEMAHELMTKVRADEEATPLEKARVMSALSVTLNHLDKRTGDIGSRLFQLPIWKRIEKALETGLDGHPKAAEAVARELRKLDGS